MEQMKSGALESTPAQSKEQFLKSPKYNRLAEKKIKIIKGKIKTRIRKRKKNLTMKL